ncbi:MAG: asparagine synthase (glutamine-hydrolyzing) [Turicibacter sp.]|nr:asparagine synthase (glutamine-hydrolyzing) [Turicibacter sp.]
MCGLVVLMKDKPTIEDAQFMHEALKRIKHRGPDDEQLYLFDPLILGFNRLSIIDLEGGQQPFHSSDGSCHLVFNGEIYNYLELRHQLEKLGFSFETYSEAEVLLTLYQLLGTEFISQLRGMFSLVLYDDKTKQLFAVRDQFGIKPLYYYLFNEGIFLASELKVFKSVYTKEEVLDFRSLQHYFTFQYIPEPNTCFSSVKTLEAGTYLTYSLAKGVEVKRYASIELLPTKKTVGLLKEELQQAIVSSVRSHLQSDVEVGCFLSGGVDSTILTTCAKAFKDDLKAFTIGFEEEGYSEINDAIKTAEKLDVQLITKVLSAEEFMKEAKEAINFIDSPVADPSSVSIYSIAKEARKHVKVILSGEGADELFGGYRVYREVDALKLFHLLSPEVKKFLLRLTDYLPPIKGKNFIKRGCIPLRDRYVGNAFVFTEKEKEQLLSFYLPSQHFTDLTHPLFDQIKHLDPLSQMQMIDLKTWLCGDILVKSDRLTMAHALELRVPFLDQQVLELAKYLTHREKIEGTQTKILLREAFEGFIPLHALESHKKGYPVPLKKWLRKDLFDEARTILLSPSCEHLIHQKKALSYLEAHAKGRGDYSRKIWTLMTFILWYESWMTPKKRCDL